MALTPFSVITSIISSSIFILVIYILRRQITFIKHFSIYSLMFICLLCILRLLYPFEMPYTLVFSSKKLLPLIQKTINKSFMTVCNIDISLIIIFYFLWFFIGILLVINKIYKLITFYHLFINIPVAPVYFDTIISKVKKNMPSHKNVKFIINRKIKIPVLLGYRSPIIFLPDLDFSIDELTGIITHEWAHYYYKHSLIKLLVDIIGCLFWWNPLFKVLNIEISHILELHSDKMVNATLNATEKKSYLKAVIKIIDNIDKYKLPSSACGLVNKSNEKFLSQRFQLLLKNYYLSPNKRNTILILIPILATFVISYLFVFQPYSIPKLNDYGQMDQIPQDAYLFETNKGYILYDSNNRLLAKISILDDSLANIPIKKEQNNYEK